MPFGKKILKIQETKIHAIPRFPAGSFAVWGSFAALYITPTNHNRSEQRDEPIKIRSNYS